MSVVNLKDCVYGQRLITRHGNLCRYVTGNRDSICYPHGVRWMDNGLLESYTATGSYYTLSKDDYMDIVEVIPFDQSDEEWVLAQTIERMWGRAS